MAGHHLVCPASLAGGESRPTTTALCSTTTLKRQVDTQRLAGLSHRPSPLSVLDPAAPAHSQLAVARHPLRSHSHVRASLAGPVVCHRCTGHKESGPTANKNEPKSIHIQKTTPAAGSTASPINTSSPAAFSSHPSASPIFHTILKIPAAAAAAPHPPSFPPSQLPFPQSAASRLVIQERSRSLTHL